MSKLVLEQTLVEVVSFWGEFSRVGVFLEEFLDQSSGFVSFLEEAEDLIDFVGHDVSVLIFLIFLAHFFLAVSLRVVFLVLIVNEGL